MKMFNKIKMASEFDVSKLEDCYFMIDGEDADVEDGAFVSVLGPREHDLYEGLLDLNARNCVAYDEEQPIFGFVDYVGVSHADVMGVTYRIGDKIAGTYPFAGEGTRVRIPEKNDMFFLGNENFEGEPEKGKFAAPEAGKTTLTVMDEAPEEGFYVEIEDDSRNLIMGQVNEGTMLYRCRVARV